KQRITSYEQRIENWRKELKTASGNDVQRINNNIKFAKEWIVEFQDILRFVSDTKVGANPDVKVYTLRPKALEELNRVASIYATKLNGDFMTATTSTSLSGKAALPTIESPLAIMY
ncbi:MAG: hypothetical protein ACK559_32525, partial [bacterium]